MLPKFGVKLPGPGGISEHGAIFHEFGASLPSFGAMHPATECFLKTVQLPVNFGIDL